MPDIQLDVAIILILYILFGLYTLFDHYRLERKLERIDRLVEDIEDNYIGKFDAQKTFWYTKVDEIRNTLEE